MSSRPSVTVVGGGIAGLVAARALTPHAEVTVVDVASEIGGKVLSTTFRGRPLDCGPDAFITRNSSATDLCRVLGLGDELIAPSAASAAIWARGRLRPFPAGLAIGIPTDVFALWRSGIVSPFGAARAALDAILPGRIPATLIEDACAGVADPSVGELIGRRLGRAAIAALVDPLIGGINASDVDVLSFAAALPQLAPLVAGRRRIVPALRPAPRDRSTNPVPVFYGLERGLGSLTRALEDTLERSGATIRRGTRVDGLGRSEDGRWLITTSEGSHLADSVVLATPAPISADLLLATSPPLANELRQIPYAGVVTVTLAWPEDAVPPSTASSLWKITRRPGSSTVGSARVLPGSGVLVPRGQGRLITAATFTSTKWPRSANPGEVVVRVSAGRHHDDRALTLDDDALVAEVRRDIEAILGITAPPLERHIERWPGSFPQYIAGHLARVIRIRALASGVGGLALCGAAFDGIGIPACIDSATAAALAVSSGFVD